MPGRPSFRPARRDTMHRTAALLLLALLAVGPARAGDFEENVSYQGKTLRAWLTDLRSTDQAIRLRASRVLAPGRPRG